MLISKLKVIAGTCALVGASFIAFAETDNTQTVENEQATSCPAYLDVTMRQLHSSKEVNLCEITKGKPVLLVNTASNCGFTPQFKGLEALHQQYKDDGLVVIGFPSDDFFQENDDEAETAKVCFKNFGVTFTMLATTPVRGSDANTVFKYLGEKTASPKWNFYKYVVSGDGKSVQRFSSTTTPDDEAVTAAIDNVLKKA